MIIDMHTHMFPPGMDKIGSAEMLIAEMDTAGVDKAVILGIYPRVKNDFIAEQARAYPDRLINFASVNPNDGQASVDMLRRCVDEHAAKGLKIHPSMQGFDIDDLPLLTPLMRAAEDLGIPVLTHSWSWLGQDSEAAPRRVITLAQAFPEITFIMAHCGGMGFFDLQPLGRLRKRGQLDNLYVDVSVILHDLASGPMWPMLRWILDIVGLDRVLFGSDFPDYTLADTVQLARTFGWSSDDLARVLGGNAQCLLQLND